MKIAHRLYIALVPAIFGILFVAALAYWGKLDRDAPEWVVFVAACSALGSLFLVWRNTRYIAQRVERLAGPHTSLDIPPPRPMAVMRSVASPAAAGTPDELDSIEQMVDQLSSAVTAAETGGRAREAAAIARVQEYALLLDEGASLVRRQLDQARIALHILMERHFGPLNDNQEEALDAARLSTESAETELARLQEIAQIDRGALVVRREPLRIVELLQSLRPQLEADARKAAVTLSIETDPGLPRIPGDRVRLQQALEFLLRHIVRHARPGAALAIATTAEPGTLQIRVTGGEAPALDADVALSRRIIQSHDGTISVGAGVTTVALTVVPPAR